MSVLECVVISSVFLPGSVLNHWIFGGGLADSVKHVKTTFSPSGIGVRGLEFKATLFGATKV